MAPTTASGATGTTAADLDAFRTAYEEHREAACLGLLPAANVRYDACLEQYLFWVAGDPSPDPLSAWGHKGEVVRSDGVPPVGCDGNLAGGTATTGDVAAAKWWASAPHRSAVYRPDFRGDLAHAEELGVASARDGHVVGAIEREGMHRADSLAQVEKVRPRHAHFADDLLALSDDDQAVRVGIGEPPQEHGVHHREDRRVRADAQRQGQDRDRRERRSARERPEPVAEVL